MHIIPADETFPAAARRCDFTFEVSCVAMPPFDGPGLGRVEPVSPYRKCYDADLRRLLRRARVAGRALLVAWDGNRLAGYIALSRAWNNYAEVEDFAVDAAHRRRGTGRALMDRAVAWAREQGLPGLRLETQSTNVPACRFYERYGFVLGGYDRHLYTALGCHTGLASHTGLDFAEPAPGSASMPEPGSIPVPDRTAVAAVNSAAPAHPETALYWYLLFPLRGAA